MSDSKHTDGPWWPVQDSRGRWYVTTYRDHETADAKPTRFGASILHGIGDHTEKRTSGNEDANARLIAAAPELLEALEWALAEMTGRTRYDNDSQYESCVGMAEAAIAKAKGTT